MVLDTIQAVKMALRSKYKVVRVHDTVLSIRAARVASMGCVDLSSVRSAFCSGSCRGGSVCLLDLSRYGSMRSGCSWSARSVRAVVAVNASGLPVVHAVIHSLAYCRGVWLPGFRVWLSIGGHSGPVA